MTSKRKVVSNLYLLLARLSALVVLSVVYWVIVFTFFIKG